MSLKEHLEATLAALSERNAKPYDGVNGILPEWMPQPLQNEFTTIRGALLNGQCDQCQVAHKAEDIHSWLAAYRNAMLPITGSRSVPYFPPEHEYELRDLAYIQDIVNLGAERGLLAYLGKGADQVYRTRAHAQDQQRRAQQPRPDGLQRVILWLLERKPDTDKDGPYIKKNLSELVGEIVDGVRIESIDDDNIEWSSADEPAQSAPVSGLKHRVSRARRELEKKIVR